MQRGEVWSAGGEVQCRQPPRDVPRSPTEGASRTPPPTVGCVTGRCEQPRGEWRTGDGAPYKAGKNQQPPATPGAMPRQRRAGACRYTAPASNPGRDAAAAASGVGACGTWFDSGGRWVMAEGLQR